MIYNSRSLKLIRTCMDLFTCTAWGLFRLTCIYSYVHGLFKVVNIRTILLNLFILCWRSNLVTPSNTCIRGCGIRYKIKTIFVKYAKIFIICPFTPWEYYFYTWIFVGVKCKISPKSIFYRKMVHLIIGYFYGRIILKTPLLDICSLFYVLTSF